jgi:hypothetical protein
LLKENLFLINRRTFKDSFYRNIKKNSLNIGIQLHINIRNVTIIVKILFFFYFKDKKINEPGKKRELIPVALINRKKMEMSPVI